MAALSEFFYRFYTISIVFVCVLFLEVVILFRSVTGNITNSDKREITATQTYLQLIEEKNPAILFADKLRLQSIIDCAVCLSEFVEGESVRKLKCKHTFHRDCLDKWLQQSFATCPLCRTKVLPDEIVAGFHRLRNPMVYDGIDEEMIFLIPALQRTGLQTLF